MSTPEFHHVILDFHAEVLDPEPLVAGTDAAEARWVPLGDVAEMSLVPGLTEFLADNGVIELFT